MDLKFDHAALQVRNMDAAIAFYTGKLSFCLDFRAVNEQEKEEYAFISSGDLRIELIRDLENDFCPPAPQKPFCPHLCLEVVDMEIALNGLKEKNIPVLKGPLAIKDEETWVYFADEDNNVLEYIQWFKKK